jgi:putative membrane protein
VRRLPTVLGLLGLGLVTGLVLWHGWSAVLWMLAGTGIGLLWISLFHVVPMALNTRAWQVLLPKTGRRSFGWFAWIFWVRESVNGLLPVARLGGEAVAARLMMRSEVRAGLSIGSLIVRLTLTLVTQLAFTVLGLFLLLLRTTDRAAIFRLGLLVPATAAILIAVLAVQRVDVFRFGMRLLGGRFAALADSGLSLDRTVRRLYRRRRSVLSCCGWQLAAWVAGAGEIWLATSYLGHPSGLVDAVILESLSQAVSTAAFLIPGALGAQEIGFVGLGALVGMGPDVALALALSRRVRDLVVYGPGLLAWQAAELRRVRGTDEARSLAASSR